MVPLVAVTDYTFLDFSRYERELASARAKLVVPASRTLEGFLRIAGTADAVLHEHLDLSADVIARMECCRVIAHHGKGVDNIDIASASVRGIVVANVPDASPHEASEHVLMLALAVARRLRSYDAAVRSGVWDVRSGEPALSAARQGARADRLRRDCTARRAKGPRARHARRRLGAASRSGSRRSTRRLVRGDRRCLRAGGRTEPAPAAERADRRHRKPRTFDAYEADRDPDQRVARRPRRRSSARASSWRPVGCSVRGWTC